MFNLFNQKEKTNDINEKLKYRYTKTKQDLKDLEEVTDATLHSQYDALAKGTQQGISTMPRLKNAMLEEAELLTDASENYARLSLKARKQSDELKTRVKEAERFERKSNKKVKKRREMSRRGKSIGRGFRKHRRDDARVEKKGGNERGGSLIRRSC